MRQSLGALAIHMSTSKWDIEEDVAKRFLLLRGEVAPRLSAPTGPHPDVFWHSPSGTIGLELTRIVGERALPQAEALRERTLTHARSMGPDLGVPDVFVWMHWQDQAPDPKVPSIDLARELIEIVRAHMPPEGSSKTLGTAYDFTEEWEHAVFDRITIDRTVQHGGVFFTTQYSAFLRPLDATYLSEIIDSKSSRLRANLPEMAEHWLVIYGANGPLSTYMDFDPEAIARKYPSSFDRVYLAFLNERRWWEVPTTARGLGA